MNTFAALAVPTRLQIVELLAQNGRMNASAIGKHFTVSAPAISQHLQVLSEADLVVMEKRGRNRIYAMNPQALTALETWAAEQVTLWDKRLDRFERYVNSLDQ